MSKLRVAVATATCVLTLLGNSAIAAETCWQPAEIEAARVRDLQTMLMLGALKCTAIESDSVARYNGFIEKKRAALINYNNVLKARFMQQNGIADGETAYHGFTTDLANSHSDRTQSASFCKLSDTLLTLATNASDTELPLLARNLSDRPYGVGDVCEVIAAVPEPAAAVTPAPEATIADAAPTATQPSAAEALEAAAVAMQAAAAAMKAQPAPAQQPVQATATPKPGNAAKKDDLTPAVVQPAPVVPPAPVG